MFLIHYQRFSKNCCDCQCVHIHFHLPVTKKGKFLIEKNVLNLYNVHDGQLLEVWFQILSKGNERIIFEFKFYIGSSLIIYFGFLGHMRTLISRELMFNLLNHILIKIPLLYIYANIDKIKNVSFLILTERYS